MLEGLDKVDWANVGIHTYNSRPQTEIPNVIRNLLSPDPEVRRDALGFLFGEGQDTGNIHDTTPYIVQFVIEILDDAASPGKADILKCLVDISGLHVYTGGRGTLSIHERRTQIFTYEALERGIPVYLKLLKHQDAKVRKYAARLLGAMSDRAADVVAALVECFDEEAEESVKSALVEAAGQALAATDTRQLELRKAYAGWFRQLVEDHPMRGVREAAARASIRAAVLSLWNLRLGERDVSPQVAPILVEQYWAKSELDDYYRRQFERAEIIQLLAQLQDPTPLLSLLEHPDTSPDEAQNVLRGLLWNLFQNGRNAEQFWQVRIYDLSRQANHYQLYVISDPQHLLGRHKAVLQRIWAVEKIWQIPTNLFSFFFGLPDSREELRALIEKS